MWRSCVHANTGLTTSSLILRARKENFSASYLLEIDAFAILCTRCATTMSMQLRTCITVRALNDWYIRGYSPRFSTALRPYSCTTLSCIVLCLHEGEAALCEGILQDHYFSV